MINFADFQAIISLPRCFPNNDIMDNMAASLTAGGIEIAVFQLQEDQFPSKFDVIISKTPLYIGMLV